MNENPFDITKAVHYTNQQLLDYWVNLPGDSGFEEMINPKSQMPMMIVGGKGSGKTHVLKYYSFSLQKLRYLENNTQSVSNQISEKGYLGLYMRAGNLNAKKFKGKIHTEEAWQAIFEYHLDLFISQISLKVFVDLIKGEPHLLKDQSSICEKIISLFDKWPEDKIPKTLEELLNCFISFQKQIDYKVNNSSLLGLPIEGLDILVTGAKLILGIPKILKEEFVFLKNVQFTYLIDEFENFTETQQKFINTLIREIEAPVSIKIGTRPYGIKTLETFSGGESIRKGAEYEEVDIDGIFRNRPSDYSNFIKQICLKRVSESGFLIKSNEALRNSLEIFDYDNLQKKLLTLKRIGHRSELERKLPIEELKEIQIIFDNLNYNSNFLYEKASYLIFYRSWKKAKSEFEFKKESELISKSLHNFIQGRELKKNKHRKILEKFKYDFIDQLSVENNLPPVYWGLDNFIRMSAGIPRLVLQIMKYTFSWANYNEERPFAMTSKISINSQREGLLQASDWFIKDAQIPGKFGVTVNQSIHRIGQYLQTLRYSNTPPECSISSFRIDKTILSPQNQKTLKFLTEYSYLIKTSDRQDKNLERNDNTYQIIGILASIWGLSLSQRGVPNLNIDLAKLIFDDDDETGKQFKLFINEIDSKYNAPFLKKKSKPNKGKTTETPSNQTKLL
ncbi:hypothetical protein [Psychroserpens sp.]|uniref:ORC-CDC6 family AAA ATPase n=1 Tax=Psychroserpens sp. TaxID=2020870 RepID=UPI002B27A45F|nr:hypothetical protein [Psychroserpens sp.]